MPHRSPYRLAALAALAALSALAASACVDDSASLLLTGPYIAQGQLETDEMTMATSIACEFEANEDALTVAAGIIDLARLDRIGQFPFNSLNIENYGTGSFVLAMAAQNRLGSSADADPTGLRANTNDVFIEGFEISWRTADGEDVIYNPGAPKDQSVTTCAGPGFRALSAKVSSAGAARVIFVPLISSRVSTGGGSSGELPCLRSQMINAFGAGNLASAPQLVQVHIRAIGETVDGQNIESDTYVFPISVCDGCSSLAGALGPEEGPLATGATPMCQVEG